jgi:hypothetical protein
MLDKNSLHDQQERHPQNPKINSAFVYLCALCGFARDRLCRSLGLFVSVTVLFYTNLTAFTAFNPTLPRVMTP